MSLTCPSLQHIQANDMVKASIRTPVACIMKEISSSVCMSSATLILPAQTATYPLLTYLPTYPFSGKFHGKGKMYSPNTGYTFEGLFQEGNIRGFGVLIDPEGKHDVST